MREQTFIIADSDCTNRNSLARAVSEFGYVIPVDTLEELGDRWPDNAWLIVADEGGQLREALACLNRSGQFYPIVAYSAKPQTARVVDVLNAGCAGYLEWDGDAQELRHRLEAIRVRGEQRASRTVSQVRAQQRLEQLTKREFEVLESVCEGRSNKEVATVLGISPRTVEIHRANVFNKLGVRNIAAAVRLSVEAQLGSGSLWGSQREMAL
ncbi:response regulator transcription factor [Qipengyuania sp.]|uniref:response regulator transcription factor n=1 Tax=Qipengyuania sp. TaxID=2004515 RepID=UPI0035C7E13F